MLELCGNLSQSLKDIQNSVEHQVWLYTSLNSCCIHQSIRGPFTFCCAAGAGEQLAALRMVLQHMQAALSALEQSRQTELGQALSQLHRDLDQLTAGIESATSSGGR